MYELTENLIILNYICVMKKNLIKFISLTILLVSVTCACQISNDYEFNKSKVILEKLKINFDKLQAKAQEAFNFCKSNNRNTDFCLLFDMSIHSGKYRGFIWNFNTNSIEERFLVSHGCCDQQWSGDKTKTNPKFSNISDSHCSSLGKYLVAERGWSNWGINVKYELDGLEASNSNARKRIIVLHSWEVINDNEVYPVGTPEGWGCPAVSDNTMKKLDLKFQQSKKPVLLWIYKEGKFN